MSQMLLAQSQMEAGVYLVFHPSIRFRQECPEQPYRIFIAVSYTHLVYEEQVGMMEMVMDVPAIHEEMEGIRKEYCKY